MLPMFCMILWKTLVLLMFSKSSMICASDAQGLEASGPANFRAAASHEEMTWATLYLYLGWFRVWRFPKLPWFLEVWRQVLDCCYYVIF